MKDFALGTLLAIGLIMAASDGPWFPWGNAVGVGFFFIATTRMQQQRPRRRV